MKKIIAVGALVALTGCASNLTKEQLARTQDVKFESNPVGAVVSLVGKSCVTPCSMNLKVHELHAAKFTLDGYFPSTKTLYASSENFGDGNGNVLGSQIASQSMGAAGALPGALMAVAVITSAGSLAESAAGNVALPDKVFADMVPTEYTEEYCKTAICPG